MISLCLATVVPLAPQGHESPRLGGSQKAGLNPAFCVVTRLGQARQGSKLGGSVSPSTHRITSMSAHLCSSSLPPDLTVYQASNRFPCLDPGLPCPSRVWKPDLTQHFPGWARAEEHQGLISPPRPEAPGVPNPQPCLCWPGGLRPDPRPLPLTPPLYLQLPACMPPSISVSGQHASSKVYILPNKILLIWDYCIKF